MLRITEMSCTCEEAVLKVEGWVTGRGTALLAEEGARLLQLAPQLVLDLEGVQFIDAAGIAVLLQAKFKQKILFSAAASFSPNVNRPPFFVDWPWEEREGAIVRVDSVWTLWKQFDPVAMIPTLRDRLSRREELPVGLAMEFDAGTKEGTNIDESRIFGQALTAAGISHRFESFEGGHTDSMLARFESRVMPFFSRAIADSL